MSVLSNVVVTPNRIVGVYRYLAQCEGGIREETLRHAMMPPSTTDESTKKPRNIVDNTLTEGENIGLWSHESDRISLREPETGMNEEALRTRIADALWAEEGVNDDLGYAIAWLLAQDPLESGWTRSRISSEIIDTKWADVTGISKKEKYGSLRDWVCYLGFGWQSNTGGNAGLVPDPTAYLRRRLPDLFDGPDQEIPFHLFVDRLATLSPVLETGYFRNEVDADLSARPGRHVAASTSFALERLECQEEVLQIEAKSDAPNPRVIQRGEKILQASDIKWIPD